MDLKKLAQCLRAEIADAEDQGHTLAGAALIIEAAADRFAALEERVAELERLMRPH